MKISLLVIDGVHAGESIEVEGIYLLVGRGPQCHVRPNSPAVSLRHCALLVRDQVCYLRDLESDTGTFINDRRLRGELEMRDGDLLRVGPLTFLLQLRTASAPDGSTPMPAGAEESPQDESPQDEVAGDHLTAGNEMPPETAADAALPGLEPCEEPPVEHAPANGHAPAESHDLGYPYGLQASPEPLPTPPPVVPRRLPVVQGRRVPAAVSQTAPAAPVPGNGTHHGPRPRVTRVTMNGTRRPPT